MPRKSGYDANSITVHAGLDGVRSHPAMYLGQLGARGLFQMCKEIADNAIDELKESQGKRDILIRIDVATQRVTVADTGRGIPIDVHRKTKLSGLETVMTILHAGAKSGAKTAYGKDSIGVHGVGASVVNALSSRFQAWTYRDGDWHSIVFSEGKTIKKMHRAKPLLKWPRRGTVVSYVPDAKIMPGKIEVGDVISWAEINRHFSPVTITLEVVEGKKSKTREFTPSTPSDLLRRYMKREDLIPSSEPLTLVAPGVRLVVAWTGSTKPLIYGSVSGSPASGTHTKGLEDAVQDAFEKTYRKKVFDGTAWVSDPLVGLCAILDVSVDQPSFEGQAKTRLATRSARKLVYDAAFPAIVKWLKAHRDVGDKIVEHARTVTRINAEFSRKQKLAKDTVQSRGRFAPPKGMLTSLAYAPEKRELYIVEGDSAKGTASDARMPWQEVFPLRGKLPNIIKDGSKALTNVEIRGIVQAVGYDPRNPNKKMRTSKVIILTDADHDGDHISVLVLTVILKLMPELFERGLVHLVDAPLFTAMSGGNMVTGNILRDMTREYGKLTHVNRMKGWGSCEVPVLRKVAFHPDTRKLIRVSPLGKKEKSKFDDLMGNDSAARHELLGIE